MKARRTLFEAVRDLCFGFVDDDDDDDAVGDSLVTDYARVRSLGVVMGESEGDLGKVGSQRGVLGYFEVFVG